MADINLQIVASLVDNASAALKGVGDSLKQLGEQAKSVGAPLAVVGAVMTAITTYAVVQAAGVQEAGTQLETTFQNQISNANSAKDAHSGLATEIKFVQDKINNLSAENEKLAATHEKTAAGAAKLNAQMAVNSDSINKYKEQLSGLTSQASLSGQSVDQLVAKFEAVAKANTSLGFSQQDSISSLNQLERVIKNPTDALSAYKTAMDLARAKGEDLNTATTQVIQGFNGMGKSLQTIGVNVKDGLAGMQAINAITEQVGGSAQKGLSDFNVQMEVMHAKIQLLAADFGTALLPILTKFTEAVSGVIDKVSKWAEAHPQLAQGIAIVFAGLGGLLTLIGGGLLLFGTLAASITAIGTAFGVTAGVVLLSVGWIVAIVVGLAVIVTLIITYHTQIWNFIKTIWNTIVQGIKDYINFWIGLLVDFLNLIDKDWKKQWQAVSDFFSQIWNGIKSIAEPIFQWISNEIKDLTNTINTLIAGPLKSVSNFASGVGNAIGGFINSTIATGSSITHIKDAVITPGGQVIQTDPSDYLFATKNPGNISGAGSIVINISGGIFTDQNGARQIANTIAKLINQQLKLRTF